MQIEWFCNMDQMVLQHRANGFVMQIERFCKHIHEIGLLSGKQIAFHMHRSCATSTKQQQQQKEKIEKH